MKLSVDMFLKLDGIDGEARDHMHRKEIEVLAWSWGASQCSATPARANSDSSGKTNIHDMYLTKYIDSSTHSLLRKIFTGDHIATGTLVVRTAGTKPLDYLKISMADIRVKSLSTGGSSGDERLSENVALSFSKVNIEYIPPLQDGKGGAAMTAGWDVVMDAPTENSCE